MHEECSEAAPIIGDPGAADMGSQRLDSTLWSQPQLWPSSEVVITARLVVDGPGGLICSSVAVADFWSGEELAVDVRPALRFPQQAALSLLFIEERIRSALQQVGLF
jgi:hypothetical protein